MGKYIVQKNTPKTYTSTGGLLMEVPPSTEYSVVFKDKEDIREVFQIPNYYQNPEGICLGVCKALNNSDIVLPLEI